MATLLRMRRVAGWTLIGIAAWLGMAVVYALGSVLTGNTGRPGTDVSTATALLAAGTLTIIAVTLLRSGRRLIVRKRDGAEDG